MQVIVGHSFFCSKGQSGKGSYKEHIGSLVPSQVHASAMCVTESIGTATICKESYIDEARFRRAGTQSTVVEHQSCEQAGTKN
jgi:hypothetical protein